MEDMRRTLDAALDDARIEHAAALTVPVVIKPDEPLDDTVYVLTGADWDGELLILNVRESDDPAEWGIA